MGSSTRNTYDRTHRIISNEIENNKIRNNGEGISRILSELLFPEKGISKIRVVMQETLYSYTCINSIKRIANIRQALTSGTLSGIGLGGISGLSNIEIKERISDIVGISNNELLKTSLSQAMDNVNILSPSTNLLEFIGQYVKNIITNFFKQFTYEDTLNSLENFNTDTYNEDIKTFMDGEVLPMIIIEMENLDFENVKEKEDFRFLGKIKKTFSKIINLLRGDED